MIIVPIPWAEEDRKGRYKEERDLISGGERIYTRVRNPNLEYIP